MDPIAALLKEIDEQAKIIEKPINSYIFIKSDGNSFFSDKKHAHNFLKYLFSQSSKHKENKLTKNNAYKFSGQAVRFVSSANSHYNEAKNKLWNDLGEPENMYNDLFDFAYYAEYNDAIITNIFYMEERLKSLLMTSDFYEKSNKSINELYKEFLKASMHKPYYTLEQVSSEQKEKVMNEVFDALPTLESQEKLLLQVAHLDQPERPNHIHRLIIKK